MNAHHSHRLHGRLLVVLTVNIFAALLPLSAEIADEELMRFVQSYLNAAQQPAPEAEVAHFADRVRYFDDGMVDQGFIAGDQRRYYQRWPQRSFELLKGPMITAHDGEAATAKFTIRYQVSGPGRRATGMTENTMRVQRFGDELRIVAISERKVNVRQLPQQTEKSCLENGIGDTRPSGPPTKTKPPAAERQPADLPAATEKPTQKPESPGKFFVPDRQTPKREAAVEKITGLSPDGSRGIPSTDVGPKRATPVPGMHGFVYPPGSAHTPGDMIDVRGYAPGQKVKDPRTGQVFLVP